MEGIRDAFSRVKTDISSIDNKIDFMNSNLSETRNKFIEMCDIMSNINSKTNTFDSRISNLEVRSDFIDEKIDRLTSTLERMNFVFSDFTEKMNNMSNELGPNLRVLDAKLDEKMANTAYFDINKDDLLDNQTNIPSERGVFDRFILDYSTYPYDISSLNGENQSISTGNGGVQTDKQTDKQTDDFVDRSSYNQKKDSSVVLGNESKLTDIDRALEVFDSLDSIKKDIRLKFKRLTEQELTVFAAIYQIEDEFGYSDYKTIAKKLYLTESSIRDYVRRLIAKGIPVEKNKVNNKEIRLGISNNLKKIASLNTILELRDL